MARLTNEQEAAIKSKNTNELVNAGAGSGKTSVVGEHFVYLMKECGFNVKDILVLTFTVDAAKEMKDRIKKSLIENGLEDKVVDLDSSNIQNFDSFTNFLLKKYGHKIDIEDFSILDGAYEDVKIKNFINEVIDEKYLNNDEKFIKMILRLSIKNDIPIRQFVYKILSVAKKKQDSEMFLKTYVDKYINETFINDLFEAFYNEIKENIHYIYNAFLDVGLEEDYNPARNKILPLLEAKTFNELKKEAELFSLPKRKSAEKYGSDEAVELRIYLALQINNIVKLINSFNKEEEIKSFYLAQREYAKMLIDVAIEVKERMETYKANSHLYNFNDIANMAIKLLEIDEVRQDAKNYFKYIMVDEYQDTSDIQEKMISLLGDNNVFMVGDIKQSIYRFRDANCQIFDNKYRDYKNGINGHKIDLTYNFRSREEMIDDINHLFILLMKKDNNPIDYFDGHVTKYGLKAYDDYHDPNLTYGFSEIIYNKEAFDEMKNEEIEASIIAEDIINKINNHVKIYDKELKCFREAEFKDFTILCDRGSHFETFKKIFNNYKIPLYIHNDIKISKNDIIIVFKNLLILLDKISREIYDEQFVYSLCSFYRSFLIGYDDSKIYELISKKTYFDEDAFKKIKELVAKCKTLNLKQTIVFMAESFSLDERLVALGDVLDNQYVFGYLCSLADSFDNEHLGLNELINFFKDIQDNDIDIKASAIKDIDNSVLIVNIHKSKGKEYPIVYYPCLTPKFNRNDEKERDVFSDVKGFLLADLIPNEDKPLIKHLFNEYEKEEDNKEKLRLLYVALTRARECAIIVRPEKYTKKNKLKESSNMLNMMYLSSSFVFRSSVYKNELTYPTLPIKEEDNKDFVLKEMKDIPYSIIEGKRASKQFVKSDNEDMLKTGQKLHYLLELCDIRTKNVDFIKNSHDKKLIEKVINNPIFDIKGLSDIIHEYSFQDKINNINGVIDCLLIGEEEIRIIDFKLKDISDNEYDEQLRIYKRYISQLETNKNISMYLLSIVDNEVREVKDEESKIN